jgi:hypothetical protein
LPSVTPIPLAISRTPIMKNLQWLERYERKYLSFIFLYLNYYPS